MTLKLTEDVCKHLFNSSFYFLLLWRKFNIGQLVENILLKFTLYWSIGLLVVYRIRLYFPNVHNCKIIAEVFCLNLLVQ